MQKYLVIIFLVFTVFLLNPIEVLGQCSMCRSIAESSVSGGQQIGRGLNNGIIYMMGIPYLILVILGYFLFKRIKQSKEITL